MPTADTLSDASARVATPTIGAEPSVDVEERVSAASVTLAEALIWIALDADTVSALSVAESDPESVRVDTAVTVSDASVTANVPLMLRTELPREVSVSSASVKDADAFSVMFDAAETVSAVSV